MGTLYTQTHRLTQTHRQTHRERETDLLLKTVASARKHVSAMSRGAV